jgi:DNA-binding MarR family transcriptional regulator
MSAGRQAAALAVLVQRGDAWTGTVANRLGISLAATRRTLHELARQGLVEHDAPPAPGASITWSPTAEGRQRSEQLRTAVLRALELEELREDERFLASLEQMQRGERA